MLCRGTRHETEIWFQEKVDDQLEACPTIERSVQKSVLNTLRCLSQSHIQMSSSCVDCDRHRNVSKCFLAFTNNVWQLQILGPKKVGIKKYQKSYFLQHEKVIAKVAEIFYEA